MRNVGGAPETYAYDTVSNQLDSVTAGGTTRLLTYSASGNTDSDDRAADPNRDFVYDSTDRLIRVEEEATVIAAYTHNAMGQRVAKTVGAATTHYLYGPGGLIGEADGDTGAVQAEYVWLGGMPLAYIQGGAVYYIHPDHLGTPQRLTGAGGSLVWDASYTPFGEAGVTGTLTFNLRFPGQYSDAETGLYYNGFRDYDPATGRYIQSDPIGLGGGWNTYAYVMGNPIELVDLTGEFAQSGAFVFAEGLINLLGIGAILSYEHEFDYSLLNEPGSAETECKSRDCKNTYPSYILCSNLYEYYEFNSEHQAKNSFFGRNTTLGKKDLGKDGPQKCIDNGSWHWRVSTRDDPNLGSITSCKCCDDSKFGEPEIKTKYRSH